MSILNTLGFTMAAGASKLGATRPLARLGMSAGAGAIYGGTLGRDPGQSWYGGAFTGALGGAALYGAARYGRAGYRTAASNYSGAALRQAGVRSSAGMSPVGSLTKLNSNPGFLAGALWKAKADFGRARAISNRGYNSFKGLFNR